MARRQTECSPSHISISSAWRPWPLDCSSRIGQSDWARGSDVLSAVTVTAALMLGAITVGLLAAFVARQAIGPNPLLALGILRSRKVAGANIVQALMTTALFGFFFLGSLDFEQVLGYRPMKIGLAFLPIAAVMAVFSIRLSARLIARSGPWAMLVGGQVVVALALVMVAVGPTIPNYMVHLLVPMALLGLGGRLSFPPLTMIAMAGVQPWSQDSHPACSTRPVRWAAPWGWPCLPRWPGRAARIWSGRARPHSWPWPMVITSRDCWPRAWSW
jgi:hypothetical protein